MASVLRPLVGCLSVVLLILLAGGTALAQQNPTAGNTEAEQKAPYRLSPGDTIFISVLEDPELDTQALILPDGRISMPVAGTAIAGGRTPDQLAALLQKRLRRNFVSAPNVTVLVTGLAEESTEEGGEEELAEVYVLGEVTRPGRYEYHPDKPISAAQALALAGGPGPFAARARIQVRERNPETGIEGFRLLDYEALEDGRISSSRDLEPLADRAVILVPERGLFE